MYPSTKPADPYYPPPSTGIPVASAASYNYPPPGDGGFQVQSQVPPPGPWSTGLCDCCDDVGNCCLTCWCPCITFGRIAEILDRGTTSCGASGALYALVMSLIGCQCMYSCFYRTKMRKQYSLHETPCNDCCLHFFCETCALCQEYRELKNRGFDMSIGWRMNADRLGLGGITVPPASQGGMTR